MVALKYSCSRRERMRDLYVLEFSLKTSQHKVSIYGREVFHCKTINVSDNSVSLVITTQCS